MSLDALRVRQVGASRVSWNAVLALMYFLSAILARFNVGFRLGARKIPERVVAAASAESGGTTTGFGWPKAEENIRS